MAHYKGRLAEILLEPYQNAAGRIACPVAAIPQPGQYLQAHDPSDPLEVIPTSIFAAGESSRSRSGEASFPAAGPLPPDWQPGTQLRLRGPLGHGFQLPTKLRRLALAAIGGGPARLLPLVTERVAEVVLFCDSQVGELPMSVEIQGLDALPSALAWADFLAFDIPLDKLDELATNLGVKERLPRSLSGQALVLAPMPCGGLAQCGVCALATRSGARLACENGPVFDLHELI
jgi:dihydroorotate dehydrogenase electron transfer subunit